MDDDDDDDADEEEPEASASVTDERCREEAEDNVGIR
jgi:hypothetical protein